MMQMNWLKSNNKLHFFILLSFYSFNAIAQNSLDDFKKKFPDYNEVILNDNNSYDISIDNKKIKVLLNSLNESMILSENGIYNNKESISHSDLIKLIDYEAYTILNNNGKEKTIKVTQTSEKKQNDGSVFHDDVLERQLIFPNIEPGAKKLYKYQTEFVDPFLLHKFVFGSGLPIENSSLEVKVDKNIVIGYKIFNDPNNEIEFTQSEKKGKTIYKWSVKNSKPIKLEDNSPGLLYIVPHIMIFIKNYTIDNKTEEVLGSIDNLYAYYRRFVSQTNKIQSVELKAKSIELTADKSTELEKIKSIFYWVKGNINYIAFENGYEGFIPREPSLVFERKFGDCKDMATIIKAMANYAGIKNVSLCWIGTRSLPYSYSDIATPSVDNHMIAAYNNNGEYIFLDATDKQTVFGIPTSFIQGKEGLIENGDTYKIVKLPITPSEKNKVSQQVSLSLINDKLVGKGKMEFNGYNRSELLYSLGDANNKTRMDIIKSIVIKGNNKFKLIDYTEENITEKDKPYFINFNFELENYIVKLDKELYVNLFLDRNLEKTLIEKDRSSKYDLDYLTLSNSTYELEIPKDYSVKYLPKDVSIDNELISAKFNFKQKDNKVILYAEFNQKKLLLEKSDFSLWNETIKTIKKNYSETIILATK